MDAPELAPSMTSVLATPIAPRRFLWAAVMAGVVAGLLAFLAGELIYQLYRPQMFPRMGMRPTRQSIMLRDSAIMTCASLSFASLGGLLGMTLGIAGGMAERTTRKAIVGAMLGLALGGGIGGVVSWVVLPISEKNKDPDALDLVVPLLTHGAIWSALGAASGLAFGLRFGQGHWKAATVGGFAGAALATVLYELVGAVAFAFARTDQPLSNTATTRGLAHLLVALFAATGVALAVWNTSTAPASSKRSG